MFRAPPVCLTPLLSLLTATVKAIAIPAINATKPAIITLAGVISPITFFTTAVSVFNWLINQPNIPLACEEPPPVLPALNWLALLVEETVSVKLLNIDLNLLNALESLLIIPSSYTQIKCFFGYLTEFSQAEIPPVRQSAHRHSHLAFCTACTAEGSGLP